MKRSTNLIQILQALQVVSTLCKSGGNLKAKSGGKLNTTLFSGGPNMDQLVSILLGKVIPKAKKRVLDKAADILLSSDEYDEYFFGRLQKISTSISANVIHLSQDIAVVKKCRTHQVSTGIIREDNAYDK